MEMNQEEKKREWLFLRLTCTSTQLTAKVGNGSEKRKREWLLVISDRPEIGYRPKILISNIGCIIKLISVAIFVTFGGKSVSSERHTWLLLVISVTFDTQSTN